MPGDASEVFARSEVSRHENAVGHAFLAACLDELPCSTRRWIVTAGALATCMRLHSTLAIKNGWSFFWRPFFFFGARFFFCGWLVSARTVPLLQAVARKN